jgi:SAM-dependent methyltransferase
MSGLTAPSPFFLEQTAALTRAARLGPVLDLACGRGRHSLAAAEAGVRVVGVDRNREFLAELRERARHADLPLECLRADIENPPEIPLYPGSCGTILVFRFLFRPLAPKIVETLAPGGLLLYETFTRKQLELGSGPKNPAHLLAAGELPALFPELEVDSYREDVSGGERPAALAHLAAYKPKRPA